MDIYSFWVKTEICFPSNKFLTFIASKYDPLKTSTITIFLKLIMRFFLRRVNGYIYPSIQKSKISYPLSDNLKISPKTPLAVTADPAPAP